MLKRLFPAYKYVPLDDPFIEDQAKENPDMFLMLNPPPVFLDEVQRAPTLFRYIKMKSDESNERGRFLLSGSQPLGSRYKNFLNNFLPRISMRHYFSFYTLDSQRV